jgi:tetratricopeptide (TPR) repeat protein
MAWKAHDCSEAIAHFWLVPDDAPTKGRALYYAARCLHQSKDYKQAKEVYERALQADPRIARAHAFLATILLAEGDTIGAMDHQLRAYELDPSLRNAKVAVDDW